MYSQYLMHYLLFSLTVQSPGAIEHWLVYCDKTSIPSCCVQLLSEAVFSVSILLSLKCCWVVLLQSTVYILLWSSGWSHVNREATKLLLKKWKVLVSNIFWCLSFFIIRSMDWSRLLAPGLSCICASILFFYFFYQATNDQHVWLCQADQR